MKLRDPNLGIIDTRLVADVANNGTFTVGYPNGLVQGNFTGDLAAAGAYCVVADNDKWTVAASQVSFTYGSTTITVTNTSGVTWKANSRFQAKLGAQIGSDVVNINIPIALANITGNNDVVTNMRLGVVGNIEHVEWVQGKPVTTGSKLATLTPAINGTPVTGGAVALTSAACTPLGTVIAGSAPTAGYALTADSTFSVKATGVTAFAEGDGFLALRIRRAYPDQY